MGKKKCRHEEILKDIMDLFDMKVIDVNVNLLGVGLNSYDLVSLVSYELSKYNIKSARDFYMNEIWSIAGLSKYINDLNGIR